MTRMRAIKWTLWTLALVVEALTVCSCASKHRVSGAAVPSPALVRPPAPAVDISHPPSPSPRDSQGVARVQALLRLLSEYDRSGRDPRKRFVSFEIDQEADANAHISPTRSAPCTRVGISGVRVKFLPNNELNVALSSTVDFESIQKRSEVTPVLPAPMLSALRDVQIHLKFEAEEGSLRFTLPGGTCRGWVGAFPKALMDAVIQFIGERQRERYNTRQPIPLPFGVQRVWTEPQVLAAETRRP